MGAGHGTEKHVAAEMRSLAKAALGEAKNIRFQEDNVMKAFMQWDKDGSGCISKEELTHALVELNPRIKASHVDIMMATADVDNDGSISYDEMLAWLFSAPHLKRYVEALDEVRQAGSNTKAVRKKLIPIIEEVFRWHDKDGSRILDRDESIVFFANYVSTAAGPATAKKAKKRAINTLAKESGVDDARLRDLAGKLDAYWAGLMDAYKRNADKRNRKAFAVLDINEDGQLREEEVVEALLPGTYTHGKLIEALGLIGTRQGFQKAVEDLDWMTPDLFSTMMRNLSSELQNM